eukprot:7380077-Prymnesium_polylepis.1
MTQWWQFMPDTYAQDVGDLQADMYAYNMAAAHLGIGHVTMQHYMISSPMDSNSEGWDAVDALYDESRSRRHSCREAGMRTDDGKRWVVPTLTHACQRFTAHHAGNSPMNATKSSRTDEHVWLFHKGHVPPNILECDQPLLRPPPDDLLDVQTSLMSHRHAFLVCALHRQVNEAARDYKRKYCAPADTNLRECVRLTEGGMGSPEFPGSFARRQC